MPPVQRQGRLPGSNAPILKDNFVQSLDFNAAGRFTDYSTSGQVQTWKLGLTSQINDDIRVRASWSADIRAPLFRSCSPASRRDSTRLRLLTSSTS
jgi:outer membrane receptor protein involved in Fe transport